jgi:hypothetical protein
MSTTTKGILAFFFYKNESNLVILFQVQCCQGRTFAGTFNNHLHFCCCYCVVLFLMGFVALVLSLITSKQIGDLFRGQFRDFVV